MSRRTIVPIFAALLLCFNAGNLSATEHPDQVPEKAKIEQNVGKTLDLGLMFTDEHGKTAPLRDFILPNRPFVVTPVYYRCPGLCTLTLNGLVDAMNSTDLKLGTDFDVLSVSFNPAETPELASNKAQNYYPHLKVPENGPKGWRFLTGSPENVSALMQALGFHYEPDEKQSGQFMHAAAIMIAASNGTLSRYFGGVLYDPKEFRLSLVDASAGRIGGVMDLVLLFCFHFDPTKGKYTLCVMRITQAICGAVVLALAIVLMRMRRNERRTEARA